MELESIDKSKSSSSVKNKTTGIAFQLSSEPNDILTKSAESNIRAKKNEARLRLEDHLRRFPNSNWQTE